MHIGRRLETLGRLVPEGSVLVDVGTDHAYLPVWLIEQGRIKKAVAGDIAAGPCQAARSTIAQHGLQKEIEVRMGSGLSVVEPGEAGCITIAGMGASTMIAILEADLAVAEAAEVLILQPMAGAASLRKWLCLHGWELTDEELVDDEPHFYEIMVARRGISKKYSEAEYAVGPVLLTKGHELLGKQLGRQLIATHQLLENMGRSERAKESSRYHELQNLEAALEVLADEYSNRR